MVAAEEIVSRRGWSVTLKSVSRAAIAEVRNIIAAQFLKSGADALMADARLLPGNGVKLSKQAAGLLLSRTLCRFNWSLQHMLESALLVFRIPVSCVAVR